MHRLQQSNLMIQAGDPLIDRYGRMQAYLRIAVTDRCNLSCLYCRPDERMPWRNRDDILSFEEIHRIAGIFTAMGIRKIRLTGGEPTTRRELVSLITRLAALGLQTLAMTTNGMLLHELAPSLRAAGLSALNISLDTLQAERFTAITRHNRLSDVLAGIQAALEAGFRPVKVNTVIMAGVNDDELLDFVEFVRFRPINIRFIEYMPFKENSWSPHRFISASEMRERISARYSLHPQAAVDRTAVAENYLLDGFLGTVSFITPLSNTFCERCSRLRLTADGSIKSCLFHPAEVNVRQAMRAGAADDELAALIRAAVMTKPKAHPPAAELATANHRCMSDIGG